MCRTFIIDYGMMIDGLSAAQAQNHNIVTMIISRENAGHPESR